MAVTSEFARTLRDRRRQLGLSRTRLAERSGLTSTDIARWERGDGLPDPDTLLVLADAVGFDDDETGNLIDAAAIVDLTGPDVSVRIVDTDAPPPSPFPERTRLVRSTEPRFVDRVRTVVERAIGGPTQDRVRSASSDQPDSADEPTLAPPPSRRTGIDVMTRRDAPERRVAGAEDETSIYLARRVATGTVLAALAILLWWAVGELGEGLGDLFDLFRSPSELDSISNP